MKNLIVIRHSGDPERLKFCSSKIEQSAVDFCVIQEKYHEDFQENKIIENFLCLSDAFLKNNSLKKLKNKTGWVCGDYIFYAAQEFFPGYDYYWVIDDDLFLNLNIDKFIDKANLIESDLMANSFGKSSNKWYWFHRLKEKFPNEVYAMFFGIVRLSAKAIDFLRIERASYFNIADDLYPNDESFVASHLANNGYVCINMRTKFGELNPYFSLNNPVLYEEVLSPEFAEKIIHPICDRSRALSKMSGTSLSEDAKIDTLFRWYVNFGSYFIENNFKKDCLKIFNEKTGNNFFKKIPNLYKNFFHSHLIKKWFYSPRLLVCEFSNENLIFALDIHWNGKINFIARGVEARQFLKDALRGNEELMVDGEFSERFSCFSKYFDESREESLAEQKISFLIDYLLSLRAK